MEYQNPKPAEGINNSHEHPLKEFAVLVGGISIIVLAAIVILNAIAGQIAKRIPFTFEQSMVQQFELSKVEESPQQQYLQELADRLIPHMELPEGMTISVHYDDSDTVNAFATLGGNLIFFKGLIDKMESEDELAAVMGHEIAHIKFRHPVVALGKGLTLATLAAFTSGASGSSAGQWLIGSSANLTMMKFSREQESMADAAAAQMLQSYYGHVGGVKDLFETFSRLEGYEAEGVRAASGAVSNVKIAEIFRSHPYSVDRWAVLEKLASQNNWELVGKRKALLFPELPEQQ